MQFGYETVTERQVKAELDKHFGQGRVATCVLDGPGVWRVRLLDGRAAYAVAQGDGTVRIGEPEEVC